MRSLSQSRTEREVNGPGERRQPMTRHSTDSVNLEDPAASSSQRVGVPNRAGTGPIFLINATAAPARGQETSRLEVARKRGSENPTGEWSGCRKLPIDGHPGSFSIRLVDACSQDRPAGNAGGPGMIAAATIEPNLEIPNIFCNKDLRLRKRLPRVTKEPDLPGSRGGQVRSTSDRSTRAREATFV